MQTGLGIFPGSSMPLPLIRHGPRSRISGAGFPRRRSERLAQAPGEGNDVDERNGLSCLPPDGRPRRASGGNRWPRRDLLRHWPRDARVSHGFPSPPFLLVVVFTLVVMWLVGRGAAMVIDNLGYDRGPARQRSPRFDGPVYPQVLPTGGAAAAAGGEHVRSSRRDRLPRPDCRAREGERSRSVRQSDRIPHHH